MDTSSVATSEERPKGRLETHLLELVGVEVRRQGRVDDWRVVLGRHLCPSLDVHLDKRLAADSALDTPRRTGG